MNVFGAYHQEGNNEKRSKDGGHKVDSVLCRLMLCCRFFFGLLSNCKGGCLGVLCWIYRLDKLLDLNRR